MAVLLVCQPECHAAVALALAGSGLTLEVRVPIPSRFEFFRRWHLAVPVFASVCQCGTGTGSVVVLQVLVVVVLLLYYTILYYTNGKTYSTTLGQLESKKSVYDCTHAGPIWTT